MALMDIVKNAGGYRSPLQQKMHEEWEKTLQLTRNPIDFQIIEDIKKMAEDSAKSKHAADVLKSISESASDAAASAGRASSQAAFYDALSKAAKNQNAAIASADAAYFENLQRAKNLLDRGIMPGSLEEPATTNNDVIQSAAEGYEKSMTDENYNLPEVQVKSDFGKYLLIGGGVLLAIYFLRGKKKNA
jgi:hypothetical protein